MRRRPCRHCETIIREAMISKAYITLIASRFVRCCYGGAAEPARRSRSCVYRATIPAARDNGRSSTIPAKAGIDAITTHYPADRWVPAFAGTAPKRSLILAAGMIFAIAMGAAMPGANAQQVLGWLELKPLPGRHVVQITGHALALETAAGLEFTMSVAREGGGGKSVSRQSGRIDLAPGESKSLSSTSINVEPGGDLTITLKILDRGQEVFGTVMTAKQADRQSL